MMSLFRSGAELRRLSRDARDAPGDALLSVLDSEKKFELARSRRESLKRSLSVKYAIARDRGVYVENGEDLLAELDSWPGEFVRGCAHDDGNMLVLAVFSEDATRFLGASAIHGATAPEPADP